MTTLGVFRDDFYNPTATLPQSVINTTTQNGGTLVAGNMVGGTEVYIAFSGQTTAQSITTDTAVNIINALGGKIPVAGGQYSASYFIQMINNNTVSGAITLTGGAGVTISGTATIAISTNRQFNVQITSPTTLTLTNVGSGTN